MGTDRFGNGIVAERPVTISGKSRSRPGSACSPPIARSFQVGEALCAGRPPQPDGPRPGALVTWEAGRILDYRVVDVAEGTNPIAWEPGSAAVSGLHARRGPDGRGRSFHEGADWS